MRQWAWSRETGSAWARVPSQPGGVLPHLTRPFSAPVQPYCWAIGINATDMFTCTGAARTRGESAREQHCVWPKPEENAVGAIPQTQESRCRRAPYPCCTARTTPRSPRRVSSAGARRTRAARPPRSALCLRRDQEGLGGQTPRWTPLHPGTRPLVLAACPRGTPPSGDLGRSLGASPQARIKGLPTHCSVLASAAGAAAPVVRTRDCVHKLRRYYTCDRSPAQAAPAQGRRHTRKGRMPGSTAAPWPADGRTMAGKPQTARF